MQGMFAGCNTTAEIKNLYRKLAFQHHPDVGGTEEGMRKVNHDYHRALHGLDGETSFDERGNEHTYYYSATREQAVCDMFNTLIKLQMTSVEIEIIGRWIWIRGDTRPHRLALKKLKCRWHSKRGCWYWHGPAGRTRYSGLSFSQLRAAYGSTFADETATAA